MKGTINANINQAKFQLLNDAKEIAEHYTIVDLIRNDLNRVAKKVHVSRFRYLDHIITEQNSIYQTSSEIQAKLPNDYLARLGDIIFDLLPAGSISGAPKKASLTIIDQVESHQRDFYTGIAGFFNGHEFDSCVLIRFIEQKNNKLYFKSGGGLTIHSNPLQEYDEIIQKIYLPI